MIALTATWLMLALCAEPAGTVTYQPSQLTEAAGFIDAGGHLVLAANERVAVTLAAPTPFHAAGIWWLGQISQAEVRLIAVDGRTSPALPFIEDHDQSPDLIGHDRPAGANHVSGLFHDADLLATALRLDLRGPADLAELTLVWIAPSAAPPAIDRTTPPAWNGNFPKPPVYSRSAWGAAPPTCASGYCNTTHVAIHHSASVADFNSTTLTQCLSNVKAIQTYHIVTNGWCDIGYNYLVCKHGDLFEGRAGGDNVNGAHDGYNCGSMGVCLLGYFHAPYNQTPTTAMIGAAEQLAAWKCSQQGINPKGSSYYAGLGATMTNLYGHRDVKPTACPGDLAYALLPQMRNAVDGLINGTGSSNGTLKGVLYDAALGTNARIGGGTVALKDGTFVITGSDGYYEFPLPSGTYQLAGTAKGYTATWSTDTVTTGDVWESLGLAANGSLPSQTVTPLGSGKFSVAFQSDPGKPVFLLYSVTPGIPLQSASPYGIVWPNLNALSTLLLGNGLANGTLAVTIQAPIIPGLRFHTQGFVVKGGQSRLTNGAGLLVQ